MTTKTDEQIRADFEAWYEWEYSEAMPCGYSPHGYYLDARIQLLFRCYQAGRAALQSQVKNDRTLFCDLKTDEEKSAFLLSGRGYETGVIALSIQNDVAMAYHRCAEYKKELEALQSQDREYAERIQFMADEACTFNTWKQEDGSWKYRLEWDYGAEWQTEWFSTPEEAIDHARRVEGEL